MDPNTEISYLHIHIEDSPFPFESTAGDQAGHLQKQYNTAENILWKKDNTPYTIIKKNKIKKNYTRYILPRKNEEGEYTSRSFHLFKVYNVKCF